ncbi:helix-turn-helix domain-containing protein [Moraxella macacae]|uniref:helix-turn-helix domain-containing protein n=1 Tax=Moraxella macacae TaxID=765840 RepID=UPI00269DA415
MTTIRGHIIRLIPNNKQATYFAKACGIVHLVYNWALNEWQNQYKADKEYRDFCAKNNLAIDENKLNKPSEGKLRKQLNSIKRTQLPLLRRGLLFGCCA